MGVEHTRVWVRDLVRSGLLTPEELLHEVRIAVGADHPGLDPVATATAWIAEADADWRAEAARWPDDVDHDRLEDAFARLGERGVVVLQGCADHWAARDVLALRPVRGIAWFTPADVWHAIDAGMLEVNLWHGSTANVAPGEALLADALGCFAAAGLEAHFDEGRIEVAAHWQRRPRRGVSGSDRAGGT